MRPHAQLVPADDFGAFVTRGGLLIRVRGTLPDPCWDVTVELSPLDIFPPQFAVSGVRTSPICAQVETPYEASQVFPFGAAPETVTIHHAGGEAEVTVQGLPDDAPPAWRPAAGPDTEPDEAVGLSRSMSFDEAFANAVAQLGGDPAPHPDAMTTVTVTEIGAWYGGIAGFNHMVVRVRRG
jgi:hypothetical protein